MYFVEKVFEIYELTSVCKNRERPWFGLHEEIRNAHECYSWDTEKAGKNL